MLSRVLLYATATALVINTQCCLQIALAEPDAAGLFPNDAAASSSPDSPPPDSTTKVRINSAPVSAPTPTPSRPIGNPVGDVVKQIAGLWQTKGGTFQFYFSTTGGLTLSCKLARSDKESADEFRMTNGCRWVDVLDLSSHQGDLYTFTSNTAANYPGRASKLAIRYDEKATLRYNPRYPNQMVLERTIHKYSDGVDDGPGAWSPDVTFTDVTNLVRVGNR